MQKSNKRACHNVQEQAHGRRRRQGTCDKAGGLERRAVRHENAEGRRAAQEGKANLAGGVRQKLGTGGPF